MHFLLSLLPQTLLSSIILRSLPFLLPLPLRFIYPVTLWRKVSACAYDIRALNSREWADRSISFAKCHAKRRLIARGIDRVHCRGFFDFDARYGAAWSTVITRRDRRTLVKETSLCVNFQDQIGHESDLQHVFVSHLQNAIQNVQI